jgi:hypothetical protein
MTEFGTVFSLQHACRKAKLQAPCSIFCVPIYTASARYGLQLGAVYITLFRLETNAEHKSEYPIKEEGIEA